MIFSILIIDIHVQVQMGGPHTGQNLENKAIERKNQCICEALFPKCSNFFSLKNDILFGKIFWLKTRLDVDKGSNSVDVSVY